MVVVGKPRDAGVFGSELEPIDQRCESVPRLIFFLELVTQNSHGSPRLGMF